jgi:hypothetical protein
MSVLSEVNRMLLSRELFLAQYPAHQRHRLAQGINLLHKTKRRLLSIIGADL